MGAASKETGQGAGRAVGVGAGGHDIGDRAAFLRKKNCILFLTDAAPP